MKNRRLFVKQISTLAMQDRVRGRLQNTGLHQGETLHSFWG